MLIQHFLNFMLGIGPKKLLIFFGEFLRANGYTVFYDDMGRSDIRKMCFPDLRGIGDGNRNDGTSGFGRHLHAAFLEGNHVSVLTSGAFRENTDRDSLLNIFNTSQNGF